MDVNFFELSHESCGCYGNENSQNVAPIGDLCVAGNTCALFKGNFQF